MLITNAAVYSDEFKFVPGAIRIEDGRITQIITGEDGSVGNIGQTPAEECCEPEADAEDQRGQIEQIDDTEQVIDAAGCYAIPGLIDIHFHGCMGEDFCDGTEEAIRTLARYEVKNGITGICPATLTLPVEDLKHVLATAAAYVKEQMEADLLGVNMEGPFISHVKKGAQNEAYIIGCDADICREFLKAGEGLVKIIGLAPEENRDSFLSYIHAVKDEVKVSLAHTNADYETAMAAFEAGASHAVHLFNAMPEMTHREPGVVGAVADSPHVTAELICDGNHIHPGAVRAAFRMVGAERLVLISDSLRATGLGDGIIDLGGQQVLVQGTKATLVEEGNLAGSVTNLADCMRIVVREMGIPLEQAVRCATYNPAKVIGVDSERGSLTPGKIGDVVLLRKEDLSLKMVIKDGMRLDPACAQAK